MKDTKYISIRVDEILATGVTRKEIKTDRSRKFVTGISISFDPKTDTGKYLCGLVSNDHTIINRVPINFFNKDTSKLEKAKVFFPISARAFGDTLNFEIERQVSDNSTESVEAVKLDVTITTSDTEQSETYILQHVVIKAE